MRWSLLRRVDMAFQENVAAESGGGAFMVGARLNLSPLHHRVRFVGNVASYGGGLAMRDCGHMELFDITFKGNLAIDGGGFHLSSAHGQREEYLVKFVNLEENQAHILPKMLQTNKTAVSHWLKIRERFLFEFKRDWLHPDEYSQGRGGGAFISLQNQREDSSLNLQFCSASVRSNAASVGGGMHIDNSGHDISSDLCQGGTGGILESCMHLRFSQVEFTENVADSAGGGLFVRSPHSLAAYGISARSLSPDIECKTLSTDDYTFCYQGNHISCDDGACYGEQFASGAQYLELQNIDRPLSGLRSGDRLAVHHHWYTYEGSFGAEDITVAVKDALNQTIRGKTADSELIVILRSYWIGGKLRYIAVNGIVTINSTQVFGADITANLTIQSDDERKVNASLTFSTLPCPNGELPTESRSECFRCSAQSYTFEADATKCHECEENARCGGTTMLVPEEGYWHSTPFSPFIRRCVTKKACSFKYRTNFLMQYYSDPDILWTLQRFNASMNLRRSKKLFEAYPQCDIGYEGVLCGHCDGSYGHASDGSCKICRGSLLVTVVLTVLGMVVFFLVVTRKVRLSVDGVRNQLSSYLKEERRAIVNALARHRGSSLPPTLEHETPGRGDESVNPSSERRASEQEEIVEKLVDEGTSATAAGTQRALPSSERQMEEPLLGSSSAEEKLPSAELSAASGMLVATYNIFFNYIQLSSTALTLDVDWGVVITYLFNLNGNLGRFLHLEFIPLDCIFSGRDHVGTANSIVVLSQTFSGEKLMSKYKVDFLPTLRLICVVVFLAYCMDLVADLLKVFNCIDLSDDYENSHMYAEFEDLALDTVWLEDTSVVCWKGGHLGSAIAAVFGLFICLCVIVWMVVTLHRSSKRGRLRNPEFFRQYGILYLDYRTSGVALHWESILTVRRMLVAAVQVYASHKETSGFQIGLFGLLIFASLAIQNIFQPYSNNGAGEAFPDYAGREVSLLVSKRLRDRWIGFNRSITLNDLEGASLFMTLSLFIVAGCICGEELSNVESTLLLSACFLLNGVFFIFMIYRLWFGLHQYLDALAEEKEFAFTDSVAGQEDRNICLPIKLYRALTKKGDNREIIHSGNDNL